MLSSGREGVFFQTGLFMLDLKLGTENGKVQNYNHNKLSHWRTNVQVTEHEVQTTI